MIEGCGEEGKDEEENLLIEQADHLPLTHYHWNRDFNSNHIDWSVHKESIDGQNSHSSYQSHQYIEEQLQSYHLHLRSTLLQSHSSSFLFKMAIGWWATIGKLISSYSKIFITSVINESVTIDVVDIATTVMHKFLRIKHKTGKKLNSLHKQKNFNVESIKELMLNQRIHQGESCARAVITERESFQVSTDL